jgi:GntR family transcriptional regulator
MSVNDTAHRVPADGERPPTLIDRLRAIWMDAARTGEGLPGESVLAERLQVSRPALREALARLETQGLVLRRKGAGTVVNAGALQVMARFDVQVDYAEMLRQAGFVPTIELLESGRHRLTEEQAEVLGAEVGVPVMRTVKRWRADGRVAMVAIDTVLLPDETVELDPHKPLFDVVRAVTGEVVEWEVAYVSAELVDDTVAGWLEFERPAATLTLELFGVARSGARSFHAMEYHAPGVVKYGLVRTVRT